MTWFSYHAVSENECIQPFSFFSFCLKKLLLLSTRSLKVRFVPDHQIYLRNIRPPMTWCCCLLFIKFKTNIQSCNNIFSFATHCGSFLMIIKSMVAYFFDTQTLFFSKENWKRSYFNFRVNKVIVNGTHNCYSSKSLRLCKVSSSCTFQSHTVLEI